MGADGTPDLQAGRGRCGHDRTHRGRGARWRQHKACAWPAALLLLGMLVGCASPGPAPNAPQLTASSASQQAARALDRGDLPQARAMYERSLAAAESVEDFQLAGAALLNLTLVHARAGELAAGHERLDRILAAPQRYGTAMQARAAARKALLHLDGPDAEAAMRWAGAAQAACVDPCELGATLAVVRAQVAWQRGDIASATQEATTAAALALQRGQAAEQANALRLLGRARSRAGQPIEAAAALAQALAIDQRLGLPDRVALDLVYAADNEQSRAQAAAAREFLERALNVYLAAGQAKAADVVRARLAALGGPPTPTR